MDTSAVEPGEHSDHPLLDPEGDQVISPSDTTENGVEMADNDNKFLSGADFRSRPSVLVPYSEYIAKQQRAAEQLIDLDQKGSV